MSSHDASGLNPFPGLRPFRSDEHHLFFGREDQTSALLQLLRENRFLAVVGTSGSGKSSLVRAGLIAELYGGTMTQAGSSWEVIILRPGGNPIENMARALVEADLYDTEDPQTLPRLRATLGRSRFGLVEAAKQSDSLEHDANLLVVVDQFEELFRFRQQGIGSEEAAAAFVNLLLTASEQDERQIYVTITMRSDYLGDCSQIPGLAEAVNEGEYLIPRLSRDQKRDAIERPIGVGGAKISPLLVQRMLNDVGDDPDQLPVLQHALMRTWNVWLAHEDRGRAIDLQDFEATGGLANALSHHADEVYDALPSDQHRLACERIFKSLTEKGADNRGIRRPTRLGRLTSIVGCDSKAMSDVLDSYRQTGVTFLMPGPDQELTDQTVIDLSHESLMRGWQRLRQWVEEESQSARIFRRLSETSRLWQERKAGLFRDPDLQIALSWQAEEQPNAAWAQQYGGQFDEAVKFLETSREAEEAEERAKEAARQRELQSARELAETQRLRAEEQKRSAGRLRWLVAGLAVVAAAAVFAFVVARSAQHRAGIAAAEAIRERRVALERKAQADAATNKAEGAAKRLKTTLVINDFERSIEKLAAGDASGSLASLGRALSQDNTFWPGAMRALSTMSQHSFLVDEPVTIAQDDPIEDWGSSSKSDLVWSRGRDRLGFVWDARTGQRLFAIADGEPADQISFTSDGNYLVAIVGDRIKAWEARSGKPLDCDLDVQGMVGGYRMVEPESARTVLAGQFGNQIEVWDLLSGQSLTGRIDTGRRLNSTSWLVTPDGTRLCAVDREHGQLNIWRVDGGDVVRTIDTLPLQAQQIQVSPDSAIVLAQGDNYRQIGWWATDENEADKRDLKEPIAFDKRIGDIHFIKDRDRVVVVTRAMWDQADDSEADDQRGAQQEAVRRRVSIVVHDTRSGAQVAKIDPTEQVTSQVVFGNESFSIAAAVLDSSKVRVWDLETGDTISETVVQGQKVRNPIVSPDGRSFCAFLGDEFSTMRFWDLFNGQPLGEPLEHEGALAEWQFSREGARLFTADSSAYGTVRRWNLQTGKPLAEPVTLSEGNYRRTQLLADGIQAVSQYTTKFNDGALTHGELKVWNADHATAFVLPITGNVDRVTSVTYSPDGKRLLIVGQDREARTSSLAAGVSVCEIWDTERKQLVRRLHLDGTAPLVFLEIDSTGQHVVSTETRGATVWELETGRKLNHLPHDGPVMAAHFTPDNTGVVTVSGQAVNVWRITDGVERFASVPCGRSVEVAMSRDAPHVYVCDAEGNLRVVNTQDGKLAAEFKIVDGAAVDSRGGEAWERKFSEDASLLAVVPAYAPHALLFDTRSGKCLHTLRQSNTARALAFSPDGKLVAIGTGFNDETEIGEVALWETSTGRQATLPLKLNKPVSAIEFSPDGKLLATLSHLRGTLFVQIWNVSTGAPLADPVAIEGSRGELQFHPEGDQLVVHSRIGERPLADPSAVWLIDLPPIDESLPPWFPDFVSTVAGSRLNDTGGPEPMSQEQVAAVRQAVANADPSSPTARWAKWVLSGSRERTASPDATLNRNELINRLLQSTDPTELTRALQLSPVSAEVHVRMAHALATSGRLRDLPEHQRQHWLDTSKWHLRRAIELDDTNADVRAYQADILLQLNDNNAALEMARRAVELDAESLNAQYIDAIASAVAGNWEHAQQAFGRTLALLEARAPGRDLTAKIELPLLADPERLAPKEDWVAKRSLQLPEPIAGTFEDFNSVDDGSLPANWTVAGIAAPIDARQRALAVMLEFDGNWRTFSRGTIESRDRSFVAPLLRVHPSESINGEPVLRLLDGQFIATRAVRGQYLVTPEFNCSDADGVHVVFHSAYTRSPTSVAALEYSIDGGESWLPAWFRLMENEIVRDSNGQIDVAATFEPLNTIYAVRSPGSSPVKFVESELSATLAEFFETDEFIDDEGFNRVEVIRLPQADRQVRVQVRFAYVGRVPWAIDDFRLCAIDPNKQGVIVERPGAQPARMIPTANPDTLISVAGELLATATDANRNAIHARLLASAAVELMPNDPNALDQYARAVGATGDVVEAFAITEQLISTGSDADRAWTTRSWLFEELGNKYLANEQHEHAEVCFEVAATILKSLGQNDDANRGRMLKHLKDVGLLHEPQVLFSRRSIWKYLDDGSDQGTQWRQSDFDDSSWASGRARLGYGDRQTTIVNWGRNPAEKHVTTYFRTEFRQETVQGLRQLRLLLQRDDGAVVYLNGQEIARDRMPFGAIGFDTLANSPEVGNEDETRFFPFEISPEHLRVGRNVLAVEIHQVRRTSSDISFDLELEGTAFNIDAMPELDRLADLEYDLQIPDHLRVLLWTARAKLFADADKLSRATECLEQARAIQPDDPNVFWASAFLDVRNDKTDQAYPTFLQYLEQVIQSNQASATGQLFAGSLSAFLRTVDDSPPSLARAVIQGLRDDVVSVDPWELGFIERRLGELESDDPVFRQARLATLIAMENYEDGLSLIEATEQEYFNGNMVPDSDPSDYLRLMKQKETCLRRLGRHDEAEVARRASLAPPRPAGLSPKLIDLSAHYNCSLYDGTGWASLSEYNLATLPKTFVPKKGVQFDLRGVVQLDGQVSIQRTRYSELRGVDVPMKVEGIVVSQQSPAIHFLLSTSYGRETRGAEVASFVVHYDDGTSETMPVKFLDDVADWWLSSSAPVDAAQIGWSGSHVGGNVVLSELVWQNPQPAKSISHIDFISADANAAPFLIAITLE